MPPARVPMVKRRVNATIFGARCHQEQGLKRKSENSLQVIAVRIEPAIGQRLRLLAEVTGRNQSFFLKQLIEAGIDAMEETWLSDPLLAKVRSGQLVEQRPGTTRDLFADGIIDQ